MQTVLGGLYSLGGDHLKEVCLWRSYIITSTAIAAFNLTHDNIHLVPLYLSQIYLTCFKTLLRNTPNSEHQKPFWNVTENKTATLENSQQNAAALKRLWFSPCLHVLISHVIDRNKISRKVWGIHSMSSLVTINLTKHLSNVIM